jgi:antitoxin (DNA-binding transcriptional repressor) of toxin-antitoxin stability system
MGRPPTDLLGETERLIRGIVRDANRGRRVEVEVDGKVVARRVPFDTLDRTRAAEAALKFLQIKAKLPEPTGPSQYEQDLKAMNPDEPDDAGEGRAARPEAGASARFLPN